MIDERDIYII